MKHRFYVVLALLVIGATLLAGCAVPVAAPAAAPAGGDAAASDAPIELLYMTHTHAQSDPGQRGAHRAST